MPTTLDKALGIAEDAIDELAGARYRLRDIAIDEVSIVDRPANRHRFLVIKSDASANMPDSQTATVLSMPAPMKDAVMSTFADVLERMVGIANVVKDAATVDGKVELPESFVSELRTIEEALGSVPLSANVAEAVDIDKAVWTTAYVNDLPDSAFLYVSPGGKKDGDGKTVPRGLRHFPVRDQSGKLDPAHIRNALARIPQANIPAALKDALSLKARKLFSQLSKAEQGESAPATTTEGATVDPITQTPAPTPASAAAPAAATASTEPPAAAPVVVAAPAEPVEKARISAEQVKQLEEVQTAIKTLGGTVNRLMKDLIPEPTKKSDTEQAVSAMGEVVAQLKSVVAALSTTAVAPAAPAPVVAPAVAAPAVDAAASAEAVTKRLEALDLECKELRATIAKSIEAPPSRASAPNPAPAAAASGQRVLPMFYNDNTYDPPAAKA